MLSLGKTEGGSEVLGEVGDLSDGGKDLLVEGLLVGGLGLGESLLLGLVALEELGLGAVAGSRLLLGEVSVVELGVNLRASRERGNARSALHLQTLAFLLQPSQFFHQCYRNIDAQDSR